MPTVLAARPGSVTVLNDASVQGVIPPLVAFDSPQLTFDSELSIINSIGIAEATNHQFMHSLGADIYVYTFGDRMGQLQIGGLSFAKECGERGQVLAGIEHGLGRIRRFYANAKLSTRPDPVQIVIGNSPDVVEGFITGFSARVADVASRLVSWQLEIALIPEIGESSDEGESGATAGAAAGAAAGATAGNNANSQSTGSTAAEIDTNTGGSGNWARAQNQAYTSSQNLLAR